LNNLERKTAGQFAFLMAIPIMAAAGIVSIIDLVKIKDLNQFLPVLVVGFTTAGVVGFFTIRWLLGYLGKNSLLPFAVYCLILGSGTLLIAAANQDFVRLKKNEAFSSEETYQVSYSSSIQELLPAINECSDKISNASISLNRSKEGSAENEDLLISFGEVPSTHEFSYQIGKDILVLAAHQENPIKKLTSSALDTIYRKDYFTFSELIEECDECDILQENGMNLSDNIILWNYPEEFELFNLIRYSFQFTSDYFNHYIAPTTSKMVQVLSNDSRSIGFLPLQAVREPLKRITISDMAGDVASIPILASSKTKPDEVLSSLLVCIQEKVSDLEY
jgi:hypothetical protein